MQTTVSTRATIVRATVWTSLVSALASAVGVVLLRVAVASWVRLCSPGPATVDDVAAVVSTTLATVLLVGWMACVCSALLAHLPGRVGRIARRAASRLATKGARRLAAVLVGATLTGALVPGTASAGERPGTPPAGVAAPASGHGVHLRPGFLASLAVGTVTAEPPGWVPTRPVVRPQPATALVISGGGDRRPGEVVVHRGDSLWDIAARHLGPGATDAEVALAWPAWHEANRAVIGDDPDLILPGQLLRVPGEVAR
jgi:LysM domain